MKANKKSNIGEGEKNEDDREIKLKNKKNR